MRDPKLIALLFNECINAHDVNGLAELMTPDHTFVEDDGKRVGPKDVVVKAWTEFFAMFPRYRNTFTRVQSRDNEVAILGFAYWSEDQPFDPAIWTATIVDDRVREWGVHAVSDANRERFDLR